jgi:hypothetical protein
MALGHDLVGSPAVAGVARHDLIGALALAGVAWKDFVATAHATAIKVIMTTTHVMMIDVFATVAVHAAAMMMVVALHMVVTAVVPGDASTSSMCLCQGCRAGDQNRCAQVSQKFPGFDHPPPSRVAMWSSV